VHPEPSRRKLKRLVVPAVLVVATLGGAIAALSATAGCDGNSPPPADASVDAAPDTPIV
jgi:hypothetical protein